MAPLTSVARTTNGKREGDEVKKRQRQLECVRVVFFSSPGPGHQRS